MKGLYIKKITEFIAKNFKNNKEDKEVITIAAINEFIRYTQEGLSERRAYKRTISEIYSESTDKELFKGEKSSTFIMGIIIAVSTIIGIFTQEPYTTLIINTALIVGFLIVIAFREHFTFISKSKYILSLVISFIILTLISYVSMDKVIYNGYIVACFSTLMLCYYLFIKNSTINFLKSGLLLAYTLALLFNSVDFLNNAFLLTIGILFLVAMIFVSLFEAVSEIDYQKHMHLKVTLSGVLFLVASILFSTDASYLYYQIVYFASLLLMIFIFYILFFNEKMYLRTGYFNAIVVGNGFVTISMLIKLYGGQVNGTGTLYFGLLLLLSTLFSDLLSNFEKINSLPKA